MDKPLLQLETGGDWAVWLEDNHARSDGVWLVHARKGSGLLTVSYAEALLEALCYGWIDGQSKKNDESSWLQKFTPRRKRSIWSKINRDKALSLMESGRMKSAGLAEIERAQQDGRWDRAYDAYSKAEVPPDLQAALEASPAAAQFFAALSKQNRYAILFRIQNVKKAETRARKILQYVEMCGRGETIY